MSYVCQINSDLKVPVLHKTTGKAAGTYTITESKKIVAVVVQDTDNTSYLAYLINMDGNRYSGSNATNATNITYNSDTGFTYKASRKHTLYYITEG